MKAMILDDELYCAEALHIMLRRHCPQVSDSAFFTEPIPALDYLNSNQPDILFLDVEMPQVSGFDFLSQATNFKGSVIFTTAHEGYALKAFKVDAIAYLLKPIGKDDLIKAVEKVSKNTNPLKSNELIDIIQKSVLNLNNGSRKIPLPTAEGIHLLNPDEIVHCDSDGSYSHIHLLNDKPLLVSKNLRELEELFNSSHFFRIHKSHLINLSHVKFVSKQDGGDVIMKNNSIIPISRTSRQDFFNRLK